MDQAGLPWSLEVEAARRRGEIGGMCLPHPESDGLNAAISGSTSGALISQVRGKPLHIGSWQLRTVTFMKGKADYLIHNQIYLIVDYLIPTLQRLGVKDEQWKYVNLGIGANDIVSKGDADLPRMSAYDDAVQPHRASSSLRTRS